MEKVVSRMVWRSRAWRDSFPERFDVSALGESYFPNGLMFPRMARVISRMVCYFRAWRESFPEWFVISAHGESYFPNGLKLSPYAETFVRSWAMCCCLLSMIPYIFLLYNGIHLFVRRLFMAWIVPNDEPCDDRKDEERDREIIIEYSIVVFEKIENAM